MQAPQTERMIALLDREARMACKIGQLLGRAMTFHILRRSAQHPMIRRQPLRNQMRRDLVANPDIQIETFPRHIDQPVEQVQAHTQLRMLIGKTRERGRHDMPSKTKAAGNSQRAARNAARGGHVFHEMVDVIEDFLRPRIDAFARLGNGDTARGAMQQACAQVVFEHAHALADVRRRDRQDLCRRAEAGLAGDGAEDAKIIEVRGRRDIHYSRFVHSGLTKTLILSLVKRNKIITKAPYPTNGFTLSGSATRLDEHTNSEGGHPRIARGKPWADSVTGGEACGYPCSEKEGFTHRWFWRAPCFWGAKNVKTARWVNLRALVLKAFSLLRFFVALDKEMTGRHAQWLTVIKKKANSSRPLTPKAPTRHRPRPLPPEPNPPT